MRAFAFAFVLFFAFARSLDRMARPPGMRARSIPPAAAGHSRHSRCLYPHYCLPARAQQECAKPECAAAGGSTDRHLPRCCCWVVPAASPSLARSRPPTELHALFISCDSPYVHICNISWTIIGFGIELCGAVPLFQNLDFLRIMRSVPFVSQALSYLPAFRVEKTAGSNV